MTRRDWLLFRTDKGSPWGLVEMVHWCWASFIGLATLIVSEEDDE